MRERRTTIQEEIFARKIVDSAFKVHAALGPGLLESVYETCFCYELTRHSLSFKRQVEVPICYANIKFAAALRLDLLVEDCIVCELKAVDDMNPIYQAQLLSYLKLTKKKLGFLINFNVPVIRLGIKRIIL